MSTARVTLVADPYPPYQYEEDGNLKGMDYEVIVSVFHGMGCDVHVALCPWQECLRRLDRREADGIFQITRTPEREERYVFSDLLRSAKTVLLARSGEPIRLDPTKDLREELSPYSLGLLPGYSYHPAVDALDPATKTEVQRQEDLLLGVKERRFDLAIIDLGVAAFLIEKLGITGVERVEGFSVTRELFVAFRPEFRDLVPRFNGELTKLKQQGRLESITRRYGLRGAFA